MQSIKIKACLWKGPQVDMTMITSKNWQHPIEIRVDYEFSWYLIQSLFHNTVSCLQITCNKRAWGRNMETWWVFYEVMCNLGLIFDMIVCLKHMRVLSSDSAGRFFYMIFFTWDMDVELTTISLRQSDIQKE